MTGQRWAFTVEWGKVREFARAVHDDHAADPALLPTPTFPVCVTADFVERLIVEELKLDRRRVVHGEQEYEYFRPLKVGDRLSCQARVVEEYTKQGQRGGQMRFIVCETEMRDAATDELVLRERATAIEITPAEGQS